MEGFCKSELTQTFRFAAYLLHLALSYVFSPFSINSCLTKLYHECTNKVKKCAMALLPVPLRFHKCMEAAFVLWYTI